MIIEDDKTLTQILNALDMTEENVTKISVQVHRGKQVADAGDCRHIYKENRHDKLSKE